MKILIKIGMFLLILLLVFFIGRLTKEPEYVTDTVVETDTLYIKSDPIVKWKTAYIDTSKTDTFYVFETDTFYIEKNLQIASDTTNFDKDTLKVWYFFPPINKFRYEFNRAPIPTIYETKTITIVEKPKWYMRREFWLLGGFVSGIILTR